MSPEVLGSNWARLLRIARELVRQVNSEQRIIDQWTLGGGTAMMLQIDHRESHDVDLFLDDLQVLPLLDPQKHDFQLGISPSGQQSDGARFLKLSFNGIGEIDFIVAASMTDSPFKREIVENEPILLDTVPEIVAKKIFYRGSSIRPRDVFYIAAAGESHSVEIIDALKAYRSNVTQALATMNRLNPEFVNRAIAQLAIKAQYVSMTRTSLEKARRLLEAV